MLVNPLARADERRMGRRHAEQAERDIVHRRAEHGWGRSGVPAGAGRLRGEIVLVSTFQLRPPCSTSHSQPPPALAPHPPQHIPRHFDTLLVSQRVAGHIQPNDQSGDEEERTAIFARKVPVVRLDGAVKGVACRGGFERGGGVGQDGEALEVTNDCVV